MSHQVVITRLGPTHNLGHLWVPRASHYHDIRFPICPGGARWLSVMKQLYALVLLPPGTSGCPEGLVLEFLKHAGDMAILQI